MTTGQIIGSSVASWPPNRTATRDLSEDFSRMVLNVEPISGEELTICYLSALAPLSRKAFDWEDAEKRADWEESHGMFVEFGNMKDLLSDLHS